MTLWVLVFAVVVFCFGVVLLFGAPYLPTTKKQISAALDLLDLQPTQKLLELGCGDGRVARSAAQRGIHVVAYELNPILVLIARVYTFRYRKLVKIYWGDYWGKQWPEADGIYTFLLQKYMKQLDKKIIQQHSNVQVKLVSFAFRIPGKKPAKQRDGLFLYTYPGQQ